MTGDTARETGEVHVLPVGDLIEHVTEGSCPCGPRVKPVKRDDGSIGWLSVHNSLAGRERRERRYRCPVCCRVALWTDGPSVEAGDEVDEFWCQTCGTETPLHLMEIVS